jgi:signal transduction histidine kinase
MLDRIQASVHQLRALTDSLAHDLKSPITSIRGRLEEALLKDDESWHEPVADAIDHLDRLSQMLNTTLDLSEAEAGALQLHREPMDLTATVQQLAALYEPAFTDRKHTLVCNLESGTPIEVDQSLFIRTLSNLFDNEVVHLPLQRHIRLSVLVRGDDAELVIEDDGPGFSPEIKARAFERFVKSGTSTGHGLGLAFVDAVVRAHGGRISISERDGGGSKIVVALPLAKATTLIPVS